MGTGFGLSIVVILTFLIKFLFVVFVVGLVGGIFVAVKDYIFTAEDVEGFKNTFKFNKTAEKKQTCIVCGKEVNPEWKACPYCSATIEK